MLGSITLLAVASFCLLRVGESFIVAPTRPERCSSTSLAAVGVSSRRQWLLGAGSAVATVVAFQEPAVATYSSYTNREKDWQERMTKGDIVVSSSKDLRRQLREIAPMNTNDKIFCPNGPSSAVSPLMENKCGDRLAIPSVYGRSEDVVGNSIPGFKAGYASLVGESSSSMAAEVGGFPSYGGK
jgi:hypothetical protein